MASLDIPTLLSQAEELRRSGNYNPAIPLYLQILDRVPNHLAAATGLAHCYLNTGLFDESLEFFRKAAQDHPQDVNTLLDLAKTYLMLGYDEEGRQAFLQVLALDPNNEEAKRNLSYFQS